MGKNGIRQILYARQKFTGSLPPARRGSGKAVIEFTYGRKRTFAGARMIYKLGSYCPEEARTLLGVVKIDFFYVEDRSRYLFQLQRV